MPIFSNKLFNVSSTPSGTTVNSVNGKTGDVTLTAEDLGLANAYVFKGNVNTYSDLATIENPSNGDVYNVLDTGDNYACVLVDGVATWDSISGFSADWGRITGDIKDNEQLSTALDEKANLSDITDVTLEPDTEEEGNVILTAKGFVLGTDAVILTQAEYDNLPVKSATTLYIIKAS